MLISANHNPKMEVENTDHTMTLELFISFNFYLDSQCHHRGDEIDTCYIQA